MIGAPIAWTVEALAPVWKRVLQRTSIGPEEDFFDLGGDASLAKTLFVEIALVCGRNLSPLMIYQAPTLASQAAMLSQSPLPGMPPLLRLKAGPQSLAIFMAHGLGDTVMGLSDLARQMDVSCSIYGMQAKGVDGFEEPLDRVEEMAQFHLEAIKNLQPRGPYYLIGYSFGGLVALEIARRLSESGEKIGLLAMLDSYPDKRYLSLSQRVRLDWTLVKRRGAALLQRNGWQKNLQSHSQNLDGGVELRPSIAASMDEGIQRVTSAQLRALQTYRPRFYDNKVKFVRAAVRSYFPEDPRAIWTHLFNKFEVENVPGDHMEILTCQTATLAFILSRYVKESLAEKG